MTSNERKIINFLRDAKEKTHIRFIAKKTNFSSNYTQSLCHSLARAGYVKLEDSNVCHLLKKGQGHFESVAVMREVSEPVIVTANVTLLTDEPAGTSPAGDRYDKTDDNAELDKALADLEPSSKKDAGEETKLVDVETELKSESEEEIKEKEPAYEAGIETKAEAVEIEEEKKMTPQEETKKTFVDPISAVSLDKVEGVASAEKEKLDQDDKPPEDLIGALILRFFQKAAQWIKK